MTEPCSIPNEAVLYGACPVCKHVVAVHEWPSGLCSVCEAVEQIRKAK